MSFVPRESVLSILTTIQQTRRPRLLLRAARFGLAEYERQRDLKRLLRLPAAPPVSPATVRTLMELEARLEDLRTRPPQEAGDTWRAARHVEALICLIAESRLLVDAVPRGAMDLRPLSVRSGMSLPWPGAEPLPD